MPSEGFQWREGKFQLFKEACLGKWVVVQPFFWGDRMTLPHPSFDTWDEAIAFLRNKKVL